MPCYSRDVEVFLGRLRLCCLLTGATSGLGVMTFIWLGFTGVDTAWLIEIKQTATAVMTIRYTCLFYIYSCYHEFLIYQYYKIRFVLLGVMFYMISCYVWNTGNPNNILGLFLWYHVISESVGNYTASWYSELRLLLPLVLTVLSVCGLLQDNRDKWSNLLWRAQQQNRHDLNASENEK